ncbi:MAG TPA: pilus assembly protein [Pirellulaceae bacterium]|nr:pilus assembly protein [Pirellulaceae bacterium]HMO91865.1 pilus assembly protein [Pirellulaceae bacterium]HMP69725.1 pilus assembly protein [Pirellulaceae bacterium]
MQSNQDDRRSTATEKAQSGQRFELFSSQKRQRSFRALGSACRQNRSGTTSVEMAFVLPVFIFFLFAFVEFGHTLMVRSVLISTAKSAARLGSFGDKTSEDVQAYIEGRLSRAFRVEKSTILIKDASIFENDDVNYATVDVSTLPSVQLANLDSRAMFIIEIRVPYEEIALIPPFWNTNLQLYGVSVMRHE